MAQELPQADSRGYLKEAFRLFYLREGSEEIFPNHYHEFHKVIFLCGGGVYYQVEGRGYQLEPGDLLLVPAHAIHQPVLPAGRSYDRLILWIQPEVVAREGLERCFLQCQEEKEFLLKRGRYPSGDLRGKLLELEESLGTAQFGQKVLTWALFLQFMVLLNRQILGTPPGQRAEAVRSDPKIDQVLTYINGNLTDDLSVEALAGRFYLSRSWLLHQFKAITGGTLHQYVLQKRLILAAQLLREGESVGSAAARSGFSDYSAFLRAFRRVYQMSPREFK